jgi:thioesterase III
MTGHWFEYALLIREHHLDSFGHVNHATYLQIYEEARWEYITSRGFGYNEVHQTGIGPIILEISLKFKKEMRLRENVRIRGQVTEYTRLTGNFHQEILNEKNEVCSSAEFKIGLFDLKKRRLIPPTPEWLDAIGWSPIV